MHYNYFYTILIYSISLRASSTLLKVPVTMLKL